MIVYVCPKCKTELREYNLTVIPPIHVMECPKCKWKKEEREKTVFVEAQEQGGGIDGQKRKSND